MGDENVKGDLKAISGKLHNLASAMPSVKDLVVARNYKAAKESIIFILRQTENLLDALAALPIQNDNTDNAFMEVHNCRALMLKTLKFLEASGA